MPTIVYCQHEDCGEAFGQTGHLPSYCPKCKREATWATKAPVKPPAPAPATHWTPDDEEFLRSIHIRSDVKR